MQSVVALYSGREDLASDVCVRNVFCSSTADTRNNSDWISVTGVFPDRMTREFAYLFMFTYMFDECFVNVVESFCLPNEEGFHFFLTDVWYISFLFYLSLGYF